MRFGKIVISVNVPDGRDSDAEIEADSEVLDEIADKVVELSWSFLPPGWTIEVVELAWNFLPPG